VAVGRGRRAAFVARAPQRAGVLPSKLAQPQRAPKDPARAFFPRLLKDDTAPRGPEKSVITTQR
jgi:hypothetical protein